MTEPRYKQVALTPEVFDRLKALMPTSTAKTMGQLVESLLTPRSGISFNASTLSRLENYRLSPTESTEALVVAVLDELEHNVRKLLMENKP